MLDLLAICKRISPYYSVFVTSLDLFLAYLAYTNVLADFFIHQHTLVLYVVV